jgi:tetratricopeptide (TPR) repeat protein
MAFQQKNYETAEQHWQEANRQNSLVGAPDSGASIGNNLGMVYTILGEYEAAEEMLSEALALYDELGDVYRWANCMDNLVDLHEKMGNWVAARVTLETAIGRLEPKATLAHSQKMLQEMQQRLENLPES